MSDKRKSEDDDSMEQSSGLVKRQKSITEDIRPLIDQLHVTPDKNGHGGQEMLVEEESSAVVSSGETPTVGQDVITDDNRIDGNGKSSLAKEKIDNADGEIFDQASSALDPDVDNGDIEVDGPIADAVCSVVKTAATYVDDVVDEMEDMAGSGVKFGLEQMQETGIGEFVFQTQQSVEQAPGNNVVVSHPILGMGDPVSMGMHIKEHVVHGEATGHRIVTLEQGGLADQAKLRVGDILVAIDDTDVKKFSFVDVQNHFGTIRKTFSVTVIRLDKHAKGDVPKYMTFTIELGLTDGDIVGIVSIDIKTNHIFTNSDASFNISQKSRGVRRYIKVNNSTITMDSSFVSGQCEFTMNHYGSGSTGNACTFSHGSNGRALDVAEDTNQIVLSDADANLTVSNRRIDSDNRFFHRRPIYGNNAVYGLESVDKPGHFVTYDSEDNEDNVLKLTSRNGDLPAKCIPYLISTHLEMLNLLTPTVTPQNLTLTVTPQILNLIDLPIKFNCNVNKDKV